MVGPMDYKEKKHFISKMKSSVQVKNVKYGIKVPKTVAEAYRLDSENKNDLWDKAIKQELNKVIVAFKLLQEDENTPVGSNIIPIWSYM